MTEPSAILDVNCISKQRPWRHSTFIVVVGLSFLVIVVYHVQARLFSSSRPIATPYSAGASVPNASTLLLVSVREIDFGRVRAGGGMKLCFGLRTQASTSS